MGARAQEPAPRVVTLKVLLADFDDVPHPERYTREYFEELFFGLEGPGRTPEGRPLGCSVRGYFLDMSGGRLDIEGEVTDWVRIPRAITKVPHWKRGMKPFGESWTVVVAETLRASGIGGGNAAEEIRLSDGRMPQKLVFLNADWGSGGVNRGWGNLKDVLGRMGEGDLWDEGWTKLPSPFSCYPATLWRGAPESKADGTIDAVPAPEDLELLSLSLMMHEMGHELAGWPDLYGEAYEPWGAFDLMGGPVRTHFPMTACAYLRERSGWMECTDMPRASAAGLALWPLETHRQACRFPQGPWQETIVIENRQELAYPRDYGEPPKYSGQRLLIYRVDPAGRRRAMYGTKAVRKITTVFRRGGGAGMLWGAEGHAELSGATVPSSRNSLGELWWEFGSIAPGASGEVSFDARFAAADLVEGADVAQWMTSSGARLTPGHADAGEGRIEVEAGANAALRIRTAPGAAVGARYPIPGGLPRRLYLTVVLGAESALPAVVAVGPAGGTAWGEATLGPDQVGREVLLVADIAPEVNETDIVVRSGGEGSAVVEIRDAWLVGLPRTTADLVAGAGMAVLHDGAAYGPSVMTVPLGGDSAKEATGEWPVRVPERSPTLRGLVGLAAGSPVGSSAKVAMKLVIGEQEWPLVSNVAVDVVAPDKDNRANTCSNLLAVIEAPIPKEAAGKEGTIVVTASTESKTAGVLAVPYLSVCEG